MCLRRVLALLVLLLLFSSSSLRAQGFLLETRHEHGFRLPRPNPVVPSPPVPTQSYAIEELSVKTRIRDDVATVQVSQTFKNTGHQTMEVAFVFPLPYDGAIDRMTFMVDGKEFEGQLLSAPDARQIYEAYMRKNMDPALTEWLGTGLFKTSIFPVPAGARRTVSIRYSQVIKNHDNVGEFLYPLRSARYTSQPVRKISFEVNLQGQQPIKNIYSPSHSIEIDRHSDQSATVKYEAKSQIPQEDFRLFYDYDEKAVRASVLSYRPDADQPGYFMLLATPEIPKERDEVLNKTVVFAVDRSGSMSGAKMQQAKDALKFVLNHLRAGDTFNIIAYDSEVESFAPELQRFDESSRKAALAYVSGLFAGGSTNIEGALSVAMDQFKDPKRPGYLMFMTDGLPTVGEKKTAIIAQRVHQVNNTGTRLFTFGVGYDVNSRLLDKLSSENRGQAAYVRPNEEIEHAVSRLSRRIETPVLTDVQLLFEVDNHDETDGPVVNRTYPGNGFDLFAGDQLVVVGRYQSTGAAKVTLSGKVDGREKKFDYRVQLREHSKDETHAFVEKLWAVRRVGEIIDQIDLQGENEELTSELVSLSEQHGIITPYTSFLAEEDASARPRVGRLGAVRESLQRLREEAGEDAFRQRFAKGRLKSASRLPASDEAGFGETQSAAPVANASSSNADISNPNALQKRRLMHVGAKAFYWSDGCWKDAESIDADEKDAVRIERFTGAYFQLAEQYGKRITPYLAMTGKVLLQFDGQRYLVVDPPSDQR